MGYRVQFVMPAGFDAVSPRQADNNSASGVNSDGLLSDVIVLTSGEYNDTIDSGFYQSVDIDIEDTNLTPNDLTPFYVSGDENANGLLDPGEAWVFEYSIIASAEGEFYNLATVIGTPVDSNGTEYGLEPVTDEDPAHWRVFAELGDEDPPGDFTGIQGLTPGFWKQPHHLEY